MRYPDNDYSYVLIQMEDGETYRWDFGENYDALEQYILEKIRREPLNQFIRIDHKDRKKHSRSVYLNKNKIKRMEFFEDI